MMISDNKEVELIRVEQTDVLTLSSGTDGKPTVINLNDLNLD